jgi:lysozyme family protein
MANFKKAWNVNKELPAYFIYDNEPEYSNANFAEVWKGTKEFEGKYQNMPGDSANYCPAKGKPGSQLIGTKYGISAIGMAQYLKRCPTVAEMQNLSEPKAMEVAKKQYWDQVQADKIKSQALGHLIFDITYGSSYGPLHVRQAINAVGNELIKEYKSFTLSNSEIDTINKLPQKPLFNEIVKRRLQFYKGLPYEKGLTNRTTKLANMYIGNIESVAKFTNKNLLILLGISAVIGTGLYLIIRKK